MWHEILSGLWGSTLRRNEETILLCTVLVLVLALYVSSGGSRKRKLPPGPKGLPVFGYYLFLRKTPLKTLNEISKKYGNVVGLYLGPKYVVFLNDWDATKDALNQGATVNRPPSLFAEVPFNFGVDGVNGPEWVQSRRFSSKAMKDIGMNNTLWEDRVQDEAHELVQHIVQEGTRPIEVRSFFRESFANNIVNLILGKPQNSAHSFTNTVAVAVDAIMEKSPTLAMKNYSPTLGKILGVLGLETEYSLPDRLPDFSNFISNIVDSNSGSEESFVGRFQEEIENHIKTNKRNYVTEDILKGTVVALLAGGSETGRTTIIWTLMAMADNPDIQGKVHEELDRVIGKDGSVRWHDRFRVPYTFATVMESMRWATVVPLTNLRELPEDIEVQGYHIPKGTYLSTNNYALHHDPRYWKDPELFMPERFLLDGGRKINTSPQSFNPFSYGKRICPGKLMAQMEIFQYFCVLMQHLRVMPKDEKPVQYGTILGLTYQATDVELRFEPR